MIAMSPHPVPCRKCGTILQASYADQNGFACPHCLSPVCYVCGCTETRACVAVVENKDKTSRTEVTCSWTEYPGCCSTCYWRLAYELYQDATDRPADDPFYMSLGRSAFGEKGLAYGT